MQLAASNLPTMYLTGLKPSTWPSCLLLNEGFLSAEAECDLEAIADYIAMDDPRRAVSFISEIRESCFGLAYMPSRFPLVARYAASGVRRRNHGKYLIFFRVEGEHVIVLHILHGARDHLTILFSDESSD